GDRVEISGAYGAKSDLFSATTVRFNDDVFGNTPGSVAGTGTGPAMEPGLVTISGTVTDTIPNGGNIVVRERGTGRVVNLYASEDFVVRTKSGGYTTADRLNANDSVIVKAYRDSDGNYIAQTIRMR
ncbi:MAG TPA: hypothetical protein VLU46_08065, partial [Thermoanaerobaculia bacterium]|nr:hypothetical protein [Thermoanaerobaculia bacterium]